MAVDIKIAGREVTIDFGGTFLLGQVSKSITLNNEPFDVTDDNSNGWTTLAAESALKSIESALSGPLKNLELIAFYFGTSQVAAVEWTFPDGTGSKINFDAFLNNITASGDSNEPMTWDASLQSSGAVTFTAGT